MQRGHRWRWCLFATPTTIPMGPNSTRRTNAPCRASSLLNTVVTRTGSSVPSGPRKPRSTAGFRCASFFLFQRQSCAAVHNKYCFRPIRLGGEPQNTLTGSPLRKASAVRCDRAILGHHASGSSESGGVRCGQRPIALGVTYFPPRTESTACLGANWHSANIVARRCRRRCSRIPTGFFWACEQRDMFKGGLAKEAQDLYKKATRIRIPQRESRSGARRPSYCHPPNTQGRHEQEYAPRGNAEPQRFPKGPMK